MSRAGWTVHEMLISLTVTGIIVTLAGSAAAGQLRFFRGLGEVVALRTQVAQATQVAANVLRDLGSASDIHAAADSAIEASVTLGTAITCRTDTGRLVLPAATPLGHTLASYGDAPKPGDVAHVFVDDSITPGWIALQVVKVTVTAAPNCERFPFASSRWDVGTAGAVLVPAGSVVRFARRVRLSLYSASDNRWYLGLKEWNGDQQRFNTVQPVAGPLRPYHSAPETTGLIFQYLDRDAAALTAPADPQRIALVVIRARGETVGPARVPGMASPASPRYADSSLVSVFVRPP